MPGDVTLAQAGFVIVSDIQNGAGPHEGEKPLKADAGKDIGRRATGKCRIQDGRLVILVLEAGVLKHDIRVLLVDARDHDIDRFQRAAGGEIRPHLQRDGVILGGDRQGHRRGRQGGGGGGRFQKIAAGQSPGLRTVHQISFPISGIAHGIVECCRGEWPMPFPFAPCVRAWSSSIAHNRSMRGRLYPARAPAVKSWRRQSGDRVPARRFARPRSFV